MSNELKEFLKLLISFQSVSADKSKEDESKKTTEFIIEHLDELGAETQLVENEIAGKNPLIIAKIGNDDSKPTILCYSHYDVQPAAIEDGWETEPFQLAEKEGYLYGRGTDDDKGPIAVTYFSVKELLDKNEGLPVNIAFLYEGEEESGSGGFVETVSKHRDFFGNVNGILILDTAWYGENQPSLDYGYRGITYMAIEISGPKKDQHSGVVGGSIREPMTDLICLMSKLINLEGKVLVEGFYDHVKPLTDEEAKLYENIEFDVNEYKESLGVQSLLSDDPTTTLMDIWRNPCLSLHGIEGAFSGSGAKTVVPAKVIGKVSMRLVPNQDPEEIAQLFTNYVKKEFQAMNSPNSLTIKALGAGDWWDGDVDNFLFKVGHAAIVEFWKKEPVYARSGGSIPIIPFLEKLFNAPAMGLGIGQPSDGAHSQNERIRIKNLDGGKEVLKLIFQNITYYFKILQ